MKKPKKAKRKVVKKKRKMTFKDLTDAAQRIRGFLKSEVGGND